jgi:hypothetical protein
MSVMASVAVVPGGSHVLTVEFLAALAAMLTPGCILFYNLWRAINNVSRMLDQFKLEVAKSYASLKHIEDVEERLVEAINKLDQSMQKMPGQIASIFNSNRSGVKR